MTLRMQMDYLAESGLEHARGLILSPQDVVSEYWTGSVRQQLVAGSDDYYDVNVVKLGPCNYQITCDAYRERNGEEIGRSALKAQLRLDPAIAFWAGVDTSILQCITIDGDVYCNGTLTNNGTVNGDVFADALSGSISGQHNPVVDLSLQWPQVTAADFISHYSVQSVDSTLSNVTFGPYDPVRVCYTGGGNMVVAGNVHIDGMLLVDGDLTVRGNGNVITAGKNVPAFLVTGDLIIDSDAQLDVYGLGLVDGKTKLAADTVDVNVSGGLFIQGAFEQRTVDSSGNRHMGKLYGDPTWRPAGGQTDGALEFDGINDKVEEEEAASYLNGLSAVTVSLWVKSDVIGEDHGIIFTSEPTGFDEEFGIRYDMAGAFGHGTKGVKASIGTTAGYTQIESKSNMQTTGWQHLALVWQSGESLKLYADGQLDSPLYDMGPVSGTVSGVQKLMLGQGSKGTYWDGLIDDLRIYDRALDPNDIYPPTDGLSGLVLHWKLDEQGGGNIVMSSAPSNTAIIIWPTGTPRNWSSAAGAFFRSIERE
jgi:cytoskeletal protein CcmA (bactofilin family)